MRRAFHLITATLLLTGCASYERQTHSFRGAWNGGNTQKAAELANVQVYDRSDSRDGVIWLLEQGAALRANDQLPESTYAFDRAEKRMQYYESQAKVRVSKETTALVVNLATVPYEGRGYDRVMLNTYQALNYLRLGQPDAAMVELRQASDEQDAELIRNARRITSARKSAGQYQSNILRTQNDAGTRTQLDRLQPSLNMDYGAFVNPFADFLHALCLWSLSDDQRENAIVSLRRIHDTLGGPAFIADEIELVDGVLSGNKHSDLTYVIFETGVAPVRRGERLDIPLFDRDLPYVAAEFPRLENRGHPLTCAVAIGKTKMVAALICDMIWIGERSTRDVHPPSPAALATAKIGDKTEMARCRTVSSYPRRPIWDVDLAAVCRSPCRYTCDRNQPCSSAHKAKSPNTGRVNVVYVKDLLICTLEDSSIDLNKPQI